MSTRGVVIHLPDGTLTWHGVDTAAVGPVEWTADGVAVRADPSDPSHPVDVVIHPGTTGTVVPAADVARLGAAQTGDIVPAPRLTESAARRTVVGGVETLFSLPLDEPSLHLDHAEALAGLAARRAADGRFLMGSARLAEIIDTLRETGSSAAVRNLVRRVAAAAPRSVVDPRAVDEAAALGTLSPLSVLLADERETAYAHGASGASGHLLDLAAVPPRILRYAGPTTPEVVATRLGETVEVTAALAAGVDAECEETWELLAVVARGDTGAVVGAAACRPDRRSVTARIPVGRNDVPQLRVTIVGPGTDPDDVRLDPLGIQLSRIERLARGAWETTRRADAMQAWLDVDDPGSAVTQTRLSARREQAGSYARAAVAAAERAARRAGGDPRGDTVGSLARALAELPARVRAQADPTGPARPLLAELGFDEH